MRRTEVLSSQLSTSLLPQMLIMIKKNRSRIRSASRCHKGNLTQHPGPLPPGGGTLTSISHHKTPYTRKAPPRSYRTSPRHVPCTSKSSCCPKPLLLPSKHPQSYIPQPHTPILSPNHTLQHLTHIPHNLLPPRLIVA